MLLNILCICLGQLEFTAEKSIYLCSEMLVQVINKDKRILTTGWGRVNGPFGKARALITRYIAIIQYKPDSIFLSKSSLSLKKHFI